MSTPPELPLNNIASSDDDIQLKKMNFVPIPDINTASLINSFDTVQVSTSIVSAYPESVAEFLSNPDSDTRNIRSIDLVRQVNVTLVGDSDDPSVKPFKSWSDDKTRYYTGIGNNKINNNVDLYNVQRFHMIKKIRDLNIESVYPNGTVSPTVGFDMSKYICYEGKNTDGVHLSRTYSTCYELLNQLKKESNVKLTTIPDLALADLSEIGWTSYDFPSALSVSDAALQLTGSPIEPIDSSETVFNIFPFFDSLKMPVIDASGNPIPEPGKIIDHIVTPNGIKHAFLKNSDALYTLETSTPTNYFSMTNSVIVDAYKENQTVYVDKQYLLKVNLITQVYFEQNEPEEYDLQDPTSTGNFSPAKSVISPLSKSSF